ncbi:MAG TPA: hypothetical protein VNZ22_15360 [Bacillota bacterium]|nr:hypothetical protein [Bacillota bacterium]
MRKFRPLVTSLEEVVIKRENNTAIVQYKDPTYATTFLQIGPEVTQMTDQEIITIYNGILRSQAEQARIHKFVAVEPPLGSPQLHYKTESGQWVPRGQVLRCSISDTAEHGDRMPAITVDDQELSWHEFGQLLCAYAGWGMRIEFVPEEETHRRPMLEVREP